MKLVKPCKKCPYKLGIVKTITNPCPQCMLNNYNMYEIFKDRNILQNK